MIVIESSMVINRPVAEVYAYTQNHANSSQWQAGVLGAEGKTEVGAEVQYNLHVDRTGLTALEGLELLRLARGCGTYQTRGRGVFPPGPVARAWLKPPG